MITDNFERNMVRSRIFEEKNGEKVGVLEMAF